MLFVSVLFQAFVNLCQSGFICCFFFIVNVSGFPIIVCLLFAWTLPIFWPWLLCHNLDSGPVSMLEPQEPMQIGHTQLSLTMQETQRQEHLCLYCGVLNTPSLATLHREKPPSLLHRARECQCQESAACAMRCWHACCEYHVLWHLLLGSRGSNEP